MVAGICASKRFERRWRANLSRGIATMRALRPGDTNSDGGTQSLTCAMEVWLPNGELRGDYLAAIGPLDAVRMVEGATFPCAANPDAPSRLRLYPHLDPDTAELDGRRIDFTLSIQKAIRA